MKKEEKKDDKRRIPYNIWINVLGIAFFLLIASFGVFVISIGYTANQQAVEVDEDDRWDCDSLFGCKPNYKYYDLETKSNWQDNVARTVMWIIGIAIILFSFVHWDWYVNEKYWHEGEDCKKKA